MYLLSTQVLADLVSRDPDRKVFGWLARARPSGSELFASVISFGIVASSIEDLPKHGRGEWRRLLQEGRRPFLEQGTLIDVDLPIVDTWAASLRGLQLLEADDGGEGAALGDDERLVIATAIARRLTLVAPPEPYLDALCDRTALAVVAP